jgi:hypothetical protein
MNEIEDIDEKILKLLTSDDQELRKYAITLIDPYINHEVDLVIIRQRIKAMYGEHKMPWNYIYMAIHFRSHKISRRQVEETRQFMEDYTKKHGRECPNEDLRAFKERRP